MRAKHRVEFKELYRCKQANTYKMYKHLYFHFKLQLKIPLPFLASCSKDTCEPVTSASSSKIKCKDLFLKC